MTHPRIAIRDAAVADLVGAGIVAEGSVYKNRATTLAGKPLPAIGVFTAVERLSQHNQAPKQHSRILDLVVVVMEDGNDEDGIDDRIDVICAQVEDVLHADHTMAGPGADPQAGLANDVNLVDVTITPAAEGDRVYMAAVMTFEVEYLTEVEILATNDWETMHNNWAARYAPPASESTDIPT